MGEFKKFSGELRQYLRRKKSTSEKFIQETARQYSEIIARNDQDRDSWLQERLIDVTSLPGVNALSTILKHQRNGKLGKPDVAYGLYFLAKVDDDYGMVVAPIERALFGGTISKPVTFLDKIGYEPDKLNHQVEPVHDDLLNPSFPRNLNLGENYQAGRPEFMEAKAALLSDTDCSIALTTAVFGAGGYGKSSLAQELCDDDDVRKNFPGGIYWLQFGLTMSNDENSEFIRLPQAISHMLEGQYAGNTRASIIWDSEDNDILKLLEVLPEPPLLFVADDLWNQTQTNWIPKVPDNVSVLMTTRRKSIASSAENEIQIKRLSEVASCKVLTDGMGSLSSGQEARLWKLAEGFKGWPLLLNLANGVFKQQRNVSENAIDRSIRDYGEFLTSDEIDGWDISETDDDELEKRSKLVGLCIEVGLKAIHSDNRPDLLREMAVFADDVEIPFSVVADLWGQDTKENIGSVKASTRLRHFNDFSFFSSFNEDERKLRLHDEILAYFRSCFSAQQQMTLHKNLLDSIKRHCPSSWSALPADHQYGWTHVLRHLESAGVENVANDLRTDFKWLKAKLSAVGIGELQLSFEPLPKRQDARDTGRAVNLSCPAVSKHPKALAHQLFGRLGHESADNFDRIISGIVADDDFFPQPVLPHLSPLGAEMFRLAGHGNHVTSASFSATGGRVLTSSGDGTAKIWDAHNGRELVCLEGHTDWIFSASFNQTEDRIVTASADTTARLWDSRNGKELKCFSGHKHSVVSASFCSKADRVVTASFDNTARIWNTQTGDELRCLLGHTNWVSAANFNCSGDRVVTASRDGTSRIWNAHSGRAQCTLLGHDDWVKFASFSRDGKQVTTNSDDGTFRIWDAQSGKELHRRVWPSHGVSVLSISRGGDRMVTGSSDKIARIWDARGCNELFQLEGHDSVIGAVSFADDGDTVVTGSNDRTARIWHARRSKDIRGLQAKHAGSVTSASMPISAEFAVTVSDDGTARIWDTQSGEQLHCLTGHRDVIYKVSISPCGNQVATGSRDKTARIWDTQSGRELNCFDKHNRTVSSISFAPSEDRIATSSLDGTARIWNALTGDELHCLDANVRRVSYVDFNPKGNRVVTISGDRTARIWDASNGKELHCLRGHKNDIKAATFSPAGDRLVTSSYDETARVWDANTGQELHCLQEHVSTVSTVSFNTKGNLLLTSSHDGTAIIWDAFNCKKLHCLNGHQMQVVAASFDNSGRQVITGSRDRTIRIWDTFDGGLKHVIEFDSAPCSVVWCSDRIVVGLATGQVCIFNAGDHK